MDMRPEDIGKAAEALELTLERIRISDRQEDLSRRAQAMLASAGMSQPARRWFVVKVESGMDRKVAEAMTFGGIECWSPYVWAMPKRRGGMKPGHRRPVPRIAMPGYVFVKVRATVEAWSGLLSVKGTAAILGANGRPCAARDNEVDRLKAYLMHDPAARDIVTEAVKLADQVMICDGPFRSHSGTVKTVDVGRERASVEVLIFGRITPVELTLAQIRKL